jgi:hypothetical protein
MMYYHLRNISLLYLDAVADNKDVHIVCGPG